MKIAPVACDVLVKRAIIKTLNLSRIESVQDHMELKNDLGMDSMSMLSLMMNLEHYIEDFHIDPNHFDDDDFFSVETVTRYVQLQLSLNGAL